MNYEPYGIKNVMKRKFGLFLIIISTIALCAGCSNSEKIKNEEKLLVVR